MPSKVKRTGAAAGKRPKGAASQIEQRLARLESMLDLVLQASLRGRLLPSERRLIQRHLEEHKQAQRAKRAQVRKAEGPRCPACRLPIPDENAEHCPHCSVLLDVARRSRRGR
jgi:rubrerythrin